MQSVEKARARALLFLKFRPRTESELKVRLSKLGYGFETVEQVIAELKQKGLVDDRKVALYLASQQISSRPSGRRAILEALKAKGIQIELAEQTVEEASEGRDDLEVARELAKKKAASFRGVAPQAAQRRLFGFLSRRGFPPDVVYKVVREISGKGSRQEESGEIV